MLVGAGAGCGGNERGVAAMSGEWLVQGSGAGDGIAAPCGCGQRAGAKSKLCARLFF